MRSSCGGGSTASGIELTILPPGTGGNIPSGWAVFQVGPLIESSRWDELDEIESRLLALASYIESYKGDALEVEKALRILESRRGFLLGPRRKPGPKQPQVDAGPAPEKVEASPQTQSRWRKIAEHWIDIVWPFLMDAQHKSQVTQTAILKLIDERVNPPPPPPPEPRPEPIAIPGPLPEWNEPDFTVYDVDPEKEWHRAEQDVIRLSELVETLTTNDTSKALATVTARYGQLEARLQQALTTTSEYEKDAKYAKGLLAKIRLVLRVKGDRDIIPAIQKLQDAPQSYSHSSDGLGAANLADPF